jgi:hypothetical protein
VGVGHGGEARARGCGMTNITSTRC